MYFMAASREPPIANVTAKDFHVTGFYRAASQRGREETTEERQQ